MSVSDPVSHPNSAVLHCVIYGGNGFVGCAISEELVRRGHRVTVVSRTGEMPNYLYFSGAEWAKQIDWREGDALNPDLALLSDADVVITLIGSPPLPTISVGARRLQAFNNGEPNAKVIRSASQAGVKKVVLMAASIPAFAQTKKFGYYVGKQQSIAAAKKFASKEGNLAAILYPTGIYGTRYTRKGTAIPLAWCMKPVAKIQQGLPNAIAAFLPPTLVSVKNVAFSVANVCETVDCGVKEIGNAEIVAISVS